MTSEVLLSESGRVKEVRYSWFNEKGELDYETIKWFNYNDKENVLITKQIEKGTLTMGIALFSGHDKQGNPTVIHVRSQDKSLADEIQLRSYTYY